MPAGLHRTYGAQHLHFITNSCYHRWPFFDALSARDRFLPFSSRVSLCLRFFSALFEERKRQ